jgi:hypothetical protein
MGGTCDTDEDECLLQDETCENGGTCVNTAGSYTCECTSQFTGRNCTDELVSEGGTGSTGTIAVVTVVIIIVVMVIGSGSALGVHLLRRRYRKRHQSYRPSMVEEKATENLVDEEEGKERLI